MLRNDCNNSIIELQHKLMEAQGKYGDKIKPYTASVRLPEGHRKSVKDWVKYAGDFRYIRHTGILCRTSNSQNSHIQR